MSDFVYVASGTFEAHDSSFVEMYALLKADNYAIENNYLKIEKQGESYKFRIETDEKSTFTSVVSHIVEFGTLHKFDGYAYDGYNMRRSELYKLENTELILLEEELKQEYQEDADYYLFKRILESSDGANMKVSLEKYQDEVSSEILHKELITIAQTSESKDTFTHQLINLVGSDSINSELSIKVSDLWIADEANKKYQIEIYFDEEIKFFVNYEHGNFVPSNNTFTWYPINEDYSEDKKEIEVSVDIFNDNSPIITNLSYNLAKDLFNSEMDIKIQEDKEWVDPCTICENRLAKEFNGCVFCEYKKI